MSAEPPQQAGRKRPRTNYTSNPNASYRVEVPSTSQNQPSSAVAPRQVSARELHDINQYIPNRPSIQLPLEDSQKEIARQMVQLCIFNYALELQEFGYLCIAERAHHECQKAKPGHAFVKSATFSNSSVWKVAGFQLLADIPLVVLKSLVDSTLSTRVCQPALDNGEVSAFFDDTNLHAYLREPDMHSVRISYWVTRQHAGEHTPVIYAHIFHNRNGRSPTPDQLLRVIGCLQMYLSGEERYTDVCVGIDNQTRPATSSKADIRAGKHNFLQGNESRARTLLTFTIALAKVLEEQTSMRDQPWSRTLKYFGYSKDFGQRTRQHNAKSSSWLMELFEHVCRSLFRDESGVPVFGFQSYVVAYPISYQECQLGEELLCRIGSGYYYTGLGFNIQDAGLGVASSKLAEMPTAKSDALWAEILETRHSNPIWEHQLCNDFDQFNDKYLRKYENASKFGLERFEQLKRKIAELLADLDKRRHNRPLIYALEGEAKEIMGMFDDLDDQPLFQEDSMKEMLSSVREKALSGMREFAGNWCDEEFDI